MSFEGWGWGRRMFALQAMRSGEGENRSKAGLYLREGERLEVAGDTSTRPAGMDKVLVLQQSIVVHKWPPNHRKMNELLLWWGTIGTIA